MRTPTFLIVGSPKCGTTALTQYLSAHSNVFVSNPKEPHFFDGRYDKGMDSYVRDHFSAWHDEKAGGEATPSYLLVPYVAERIRRDLPGARLIAILRHPVERAYSSWWMFYSRGMEPLTFEEAIRANEHQLNDQGVWDEGLESAWRLHVEALEKGSRLKIRTYLESGYYSRHLRRYLDLFPREQMKIIFTDELLANPDLVLRDVYEFLGVGSGPEPGERGKVNTAFGSMSRPILQAARLTGAIRLRRMLPASLTNRIKRKLSLLGNQPTIDAGTRSWLVEHFNPHTRDLEDLLNVDLDNWKR
jgi:hypothetical protein